MWTSSPVPIAFIAVDGTFLEVNRALCEFTGYSEPELKGKRWQEITHPEDLPGDSESATALLANGESGYSMLKRYIRKDGAVKWLDLHVRPIRNASGSVEHFVSWILPLPNGGKFVAEKKQNNQVVVRPSVKWWDFLRDNWQASLVVGVVLLLSLWDDIKRNLASILDILK